jgi:hypothetical protein
MKKGLLLLSLLLFLACDGIEPSPPEILIDEIGVVAHVQFGDETSVCGTLLVTTSRTDRWMMVQFDDGRIIKVPVGEEVKIVIGKKYHIILQKYPRRFRKELILEEL